MSVFARPDASLAQTSEVRQITSKRAGVRGQRVVAINAMRHGHDEHAGRTHLSRHFYLRIRSGACNTDGGRSRVSHEWLGSRPYSQTSNAPVIVAAFDGTSLGREAVIQAGRQAGPHGYVVVVYAYRLPRRYRGRGVYQRRLIAARAKGLRALEELLSQRARLPEATYLPELMSGGPRDTIARIANDLGASAIVVGAQTGWRFAAVLRSLSRACLLGYSVPIVTVFEPRGAPMCSSSACASAIPDVEAWW